MQQSFAVFAYFHVFSFCHANSDSLLTPHFTLAAMLTYIQLWGKCLTLNMTILCTAGPRIAALPPVPSIPFGQTPSFGQNPGFGGFGSSMALNPTSNMAAAPFAAPGSNFGNILPNPSTHGVLASKKKKSPKSRSSRAASPHSSAQNHDHVRSQPGFIRDAKAMLVCRVSLGRLAIGGHSLRLPPKGFDAVTIAGGEVFPQALVAAIFAVFDNSQGYPEYIVHFHPQ